jgi:DNA ligase (NAD+)
MLVWIRNLGLLHWGDAMLDALTNADPPVVQSLGDLYRLTADDLAEYCSGSKMAEKCYAVLHANKNIPVELLFGSMNIPNFALSTATDVVQAGFDTVDKILAMTLEHLESVPNIGKKTAQLIYDGLREKESQVRDLSKVLNVKAPTVGSLTGKSFCITGELTRPRKAVEKQILDAGGTVKSSVGKTTTYLVTNDVTTGTSKLQNAQKYGVQIIDEEALYKILDVT